MHVYLLIDAGIYVRTYVRTYIRTYVCRYVRTYVPTYVTYVRTHVHMYVRTYIVYTKNTTRIQQEYNTNAIWTILHSCPSWPKLDPSWIQVGWQAHFLRSAAWSNWWFDLVANNPQEIALPKTMQHIESSIADLRPSAKKSQKTKSTDSTITKHKMKTERGTHTSKNKEMCCFLRDANSYCNNCVYNFSGISRRLNPMPLRRIILNAKTMKHFPENCLRCRRMKISMKMSMKKNT